MAGCMAMAACAALPLRAQGFPDPATRPVAASLPILAIPKSQLAGVTQSLGAAEISVVYRRPVARGRELFGALVPWGRVWSASADSAPVFTTTRALMVNGDSLPAGSYALWAIPDASSWTFVFSRDAHVFHLRYAGGHDALRVKAKPETGAHAETLTFSFPMVDADSARFQLHWGTTVVPLTIRVKR